MLNIFKTYRQIKDLIDLANRLSDEAPENKPKFGFLLTNRSFLVPLIGLVLSLLLAFDIPIMEPVKVYLQNNTPEQVADNIIVIIGFICFMWSQIEISMSKARAILTRKQAEKAVVEVVGDDELAKSLRNIIVPK